MLLDYLLRSIWWGVPNLQSGIPVHEQSLSYEGTDLTNPKATMRECGVGDHGFILLRRKVSVAGRYIPFRVRTRLGRR